MVKAIQTAVTADKVTFPAPNPPMVQLAVHISDLDNAQTATHTRTKGTIETRDAKLAIVVSDLELLRGYVQQLADADPANAAEIAKHAGMSIRKLPTQTKGPLTAKPNKKLSGSVDVSAKVTARRESHEWQYSLDGSKTWVDALPTLHAKTTIGGFTPGATVYFRHRALTATGREDWSAVTSVLVH